MRLPVVLLLALVALADDPDPVPAAAEQQVEPGAVLAAPEEAAPTGAEVLATATMALAAGDFHDSLKVAVPAIRQHPSLAASFEAIALLAADQLNRQAQTIPGDSLAPERGGGVYGPSSREPEQDVNPYSSGARYSYPPAGPQFGAPGGAAPPPPGRRRARIGVDLGLPTSLRVEWGNDNPNNRFSGGGLRVGATTILYSGIYPGGEVTGFADFRVAPQWEVEVNAGLALYYFYYPMPIIGAAAQRTINDNMHVNLGGKIGIYGVFTPDLAVGFLW